MGRRATPTQLKVVRGTTRPDRDQPAPQVEHKAPACPSWLPRAAKKYWKDLAPELEKAGLIGLVDGAAFAAHCDSVGKFEEVTRKLKTLEDMLDKTPQDYEVQSAIFTIRNKLWDQVIKSGSEFGLTPGARSKVKTEPAKKPEHDGWDSL